MKMWIVALCLVVCLCANMNEGDETCDIQQLTEGATYRALQSDNHRVIWSGIEFTDDDDIRTPLMLYDPLLSDDPIRITEQTTLDYLPQIEGNNVIWLSGDWMTSELFIYQIDSAQTTQIADNQPHRTQPQLHNGQVVWANADLVENSIFDAGEIYTYDVETGIITQVTDNETGDFNPDIYVGNIVWLHVERGQTQLVYRDVMGAQTLISENADPNSAPQINGQWIIWTVGNEDNQRDIWLYDLLTASEMQLSTHGLANTASMLSEDGIVWEAYDGDDTDIFYYDGEMIQQITANDEDDFSPYLDGDAIVWVGGRDGRRNIFHHDLNEAMTTQITFNDYNVAPQVDDGWIVWLGNTDLHGGDVFLHRCV